MDEPDWKQIAMALVLQYGRHAMAFVSLDVLDSVKDSDLITDRSEAEDGERIERYHLVRR